MLIFSFECDCRELICEWSCAAPNAKRKLKKKSKSSMVSEPLSWPLSLECFGVVVSCSFAILGNKVYVDQKALKGRNKFLAGRHRNIKTEWEVVIRPFEQ